MCLVNSNANNTEAIPEIDNKYEIFFVSEDDIDDLINILLTHNRQSYNELIDTDTENENCNFYPEIDVHSREFLKKLFERFGAFYVLIEYNYIDKYYRDSFYEYYSFKYHDYQRDCLRVCFFTKDLKNNLDDKAIVDIETSYLQKAFMGSMVIRPILERVIGHTLIDPKYILNNTDEYYTRTSLFRINVANHKLYVNAFPFSMQDLTTATCAEITLSSLIEYYNNEYSDYNRVLPSDILKLSKKIEFQRTLPSNGMHYSTMSKILVDAGFEPIHLHINNANGRILKNNLYHYIESGMPIAVGTKIANGLHASVCIGHGKIDCEKLDDKNNQEIFAPENSERYNSIFFIDTASLVDEFVIVDDNELPYKIISYNTNNEADFTKKELISVIIPLYKKMCLSADKAKQLCQKILSQKTYGVNQIKHKSSFATEDNPMVLRIFMCSSKSFKNSRINSLKDKKNCQSMYTNLEAPKFVWVCEIYDKDSYKSRDVLGEIVLDATASPSDGTYAVILINYVHVMYFLSNKKSLKFDTFETHEDGTFKSYNHNLRYNHNLVNEPINLSNPKTKK